MKKIALGCDHGGYRLMQEVKRRLSELGHPYEDFGTFSECYLGILICGTGVGISISANKIRGIRAALCSDCYTAEMSRRHNDSNVLAMGARVIGPGLALKIVETFLTTSFDGGRHKRRVDLITDLETK